MTNHIQVRCIAFALLLLSSPRGWSATRALSPPTRPNAVKSASPTIRQPTAPVSATPSAQGEPRVTGGGPLGYTIVFDYSDVSDPLEQLKLMEVQRSSFAGGVNYEVKSGDTTTKIARDHLGLDKTDVPRRDAIRDIVVANELPSAHKVKAGAKIIVPSMPRERINANSPGVVVYTRPVTAAGRPFDRKIIGVLPGKSEVRRAVYKNATRDEARAALRHGTAAYVAAGPFDAVFEYGRGPDDDVVPLLTADDRNQLRALAQKPVTCPAWLFIVDTGWPDLATRHSSLQGLYEVLDAAWTDLKLPVPRDLRIAPDSPWVDYTNPHCRYIQESISELVQLDNGRRVKIVYLPVGRSQNADSLLVELATLGVLLPRLNSDQIGDVNARQASLVEAREDAKSIVGAMGTIGAGGRVAINQAIVSGLTSAFGRYANGRSPRPLGFVNLSWTIPSNEIPLSIYPKFPGIIVAAAGNMRGRDFVDEGDDFARRVGLSDDTVAVINIRDGMLDESSSFTSHPGAIDRKLVGFNGRVRRSVIGTSFAAPRVAWFLAFAETVRRQPVPPSRWLYLQREWIMAARQPAGVANQYLFRPLDYVASASR